MAALLFVAIFGLRLAIHDPSALVANFYAVPIALVAAELGLRAGLAAAAVAVGFVFAWGAVKGVHLGVLGYVARAAVFVMVGGLVGRYSEARERDLAVRREATRELQLRAAELERSNSQLGQAVLRLEAFAEIARSVGGETDVRRVLELILDHGRGVVDARRLRSVIQPACRRGERSRSGAPLARCSDGPLRRRRTAGGSSSRRRGSRGRRRWRSGVSGSECSWRSTASPAAPSSTPRTRS